MWYAIMLTGQRPTVPVGQGWISRLGTLAAARFDRLPLGRA